jgi:predicted MFS family arabinose efflux permease
MGNAFVTSTTGTYITLSREARRIGASRLSSIFKSFQKLGTIAGPILIGILISIYGYIEAMIAIGVMILFGLIFFIMFSRRLRGQKEAD